VKTPITLRKFIFAAAFAQIVCFCGCSTEPIIKHVRGDFDEWESSEETEAFDAEIFEEMEKDAEGTLGEVRITVKNVGIDAAYVKYADYQSIGFGSMGFTIYDANGKVVELDESCTMPCKEDACEIIMCEAPAEMVKQILPGGEAKFVWDGTAYDFENCETPRGDVASCNRRKQVPYGAYRARFCYSYKFGFYGSDYPTRNREDTISQAWTENPQCVDFDFEMGAKPRDYNFEINADMNGAEKEFGYCGQAWTFSMLPYFYFLPGPYRVKEGSSAVLFVAPGESAVAVCLKYAGMSYYVSEASKEILLNASAFIGKNGCEKDLRSYSYAYKIPPLSAGKYAAYIETFTDVMPPSAVVKVDACEDCLQCPDGEHSRIMESCSADCGCIDKGAVCGNACISYCLASDDCDDDYRCYYGPSTQMAVFTCGPYAENECDYDWQCGKGFICEKGNSPHKRCVRDIDVRAIEDRLGRGIHCGCDAECPGTQSCVKFEPNFTKSFCAITCADNRECPEGWNCLGMTQSGLQGICVPPYDD